MVKITHEKSKIAEVKELTENIVSAQKMGIEQMRRWWEQWYPED